MSPLEATLQALPPHPRRQGVEGGQRHGHGHGAQQRGEDAVGTRLGGHLARERQDADAD